MEILKNIGFSPDQIAVYNTLLEYKKLPASTVASKAKVSRVITYKILSHFVDIGIVEKIDPPKSIALFSATSPEHLRALVERKKNEANAFESACEQAISTLKPKYNLLTDKPGVLFYEGVYGLQKLYDDVIDESSDILLIQSPKDREHPETEPLIQKQIKAQVRNNIHVRAITPLVEDTKEFIEKYDKDNLVARRVVPAELLNEPAQIIVYGTQKVGITSFEKTMITTIIDDPAIHQTFRTLFEILWKKVESDHKEIIEKLGLQYTTETEAQDL